MIFQLPVGLMYMTVSIGLQRREEDDGFHSTVSVHIARHNRKVLAAQKGRKTNSSGLTADFSLKEADTVFGRPSEWTAPPTDIEMGVSPNHAEKLHLLTRFPGH